MIHRAGGQCDVGEEKVVEYPEELLPTYNTILRDHTQLMIETISL